MWWFILGAILVAGAVAITVSVIIDKVKEHIRKKYATKYIGKKIKAKIERKEYNSVSIGLYDKYGSKIDNLTIKGDSVSDDIRKGQVITIQL